MARKYESADADAEREEERRQAWLLGTLASIGTLGTAMSPILSSVDPTLLASLGLVPAMAWGHAAGVLGKGMWTERERKSESDRRGGKKVIGLPPQRDAFQKAFAETQAKGKSMIDRYLVGFEVDTGEPLWVNDDDICGHGCVFAKTGVGKTLWLESLIFQQMLRGRASGLTFIDAKRDSATLAHIILMALIAGRIEDLVVIDPFDAVHAYNFVMTSQRADVKARKVLRAGLPPTSDQSVTKHYDRLAADSIYRMVRAMESMGLAWSIRDVAVSLSAFHLAYPQLRKMLGKIGARQAQVELGHLAASYRTPKGALDVARITDNLRGIASELHAIAGSDMGQMLCTTYTDLVLTDAILQGKIIYFMLPRLEEAESAARMVKVFREDLEVSIGEITSSRHYHLEDPHLTIIDEGSSTFGPTWANLFELARKGRFALLFGAQSAGGLTDHSLGLSEAFYERVMANVNLKVMMRVGDNRTASDMAEWIGKIHTTKKSIGAGITYSRSAAELKGSLDLGARQSGGESHSVNISEDETDLVSSEELKHEMSAEKGLAWFDLGDGRIRKGRSFWFDADIPDTWEGREFITRFQRMPHDELGLADWVDEEILLNEQREMNRRSDFVKEPDGGARQGGNVDTRPKESQAAGGANAQAAQPSGPFRISLIPGGGNRGRGRVTAVPPPVEESTMAASIPAASSPPEPTASPNSTASNKDGNRKDSGSKRRDK